MGGSMSGAAPVDGRLVVMVCRDCCCGSPRKHPDVDHGRQLAEVNASVAAWGRGEVRVTRCMGQCSDSNVIQVKRQIIGPDGGGRRETLWLGRILDLEVTKSLTSWLSLGCPGDPPEVLVPHLFGPSAERYMDAQELVDARRHIQVRVE